MIKSNRFSKTIKITFITIIPKKAYTYAQEKSNRFLYYYNKSNNRNKSNKSNNSKKGIII